MEIKTTILSKLPHQDIVEEYRNKTLTVEKMYAIDDKYCVNNLWGSSQWYTALCISELEKDKIESAIDACAKSVALRDRRDLTGKYSATYMEVSEVLYGKYKEEQARKGKSKKRKLGAG